MDVDGQIRPGGQGHRVVRHPPEDLPQQAGGQHNGPRLRHPGLHLGDNPRLQIVAADPQMISLRLHEHALQGLNGAFGGHNPPGGGNGGL